MKIAYIDPLVHSKTSNKYKYYDGLFDALSKVEDCKLCNASEVFETKFDAIIFGLGWGEFNDCNFLNKITAPRFGFIFKPQDRLDKKLKFYRFNRFNMLFTSLPNVSEYIKLSGLKCKRFCYAANPSVFKRCDNKRYDIGFSGALHSSDFYIDKAFRFPNLREKIQNYLKGRMDIKSFLNGSDSISPRINDQEEYASRIRESTMWIATPAAFDDITPRYFEVPMSGSVLICSKIPESYKDIFRHEENCIEFGDTLDDFISAFEYYNDKKELLKKISKNAANEFKGKHTWEERAKQLIEEIRQCL